MARILNLEAYPLAETISDNSYLVGTDVTDNKETKNFKIEDLKTHILPAPLTPSGTFVNATVVVDADGQISSVSTGSSSGISLTTDFTSGKATLTNNVLNIPEYGGGTVTSVNTTDSFVTITDPTTTPSISIGEASGTATGVLSSTDWTTFNNKTSNTGTVTAITSNTVNQLTVTNGSSSAELNILTATVAVGETALATGDQIASYVSSEISSIGAVTATSGAATQVAVFDGTDSIEGDANLTYNSATTSFKVSSPLDDDYSEFTNNGITQVRSTDDANLNLICYGDQSKAAETQSFKYRNTFSTPEALESGDLIASHRHIGYDGSTSNTSLYTKTFAAENWTGSAAGVYYVIDTCAIGETTPTERFRIDEDGNTKITGNVGIGTTPVASKTLAVGGNSIISGQLDLNGSGDSKLKLINYLDPTTGEKNSNYITWYKSDNTTRRGYLGFTDENTFRINVQESPDISQIILDADEIILNSTDETQSGTIKSGVWEATPIADAYIAEDYGTATSGLANRIAVFDGTDSIEGFSTFTYDSNTTSFKVSSPSDDDYSEMTNNGIVQVRSGNDANLDLICYGDQSKGAEIQSRKFRNVFDTPQALLNGDLIASHRILGATDASGASSTCMLIETRAAENFSGTNQGVRYSIDTNALGEATPTERFAIESDGNTKITGNVKVDGQAYSAIQTTTYEPTGPFNIDWDLGNVAVVDLGSASGTISFGNSNLKPGANYFIKVIQHATTPVNLNYATYFKWPSGTAPIISTGASAVDGIAFTCISASEVLANFSQDYQ